MVNYWKESVIGDNLASINYLIIRSINKLIYVIIVKLEIRLLIITSNSEITSRVREKRWDLQSLGIKLEIFKSVWIVEKVNYLGWVIYRGIKGQDRVI